MTFDAMKFESAMLRGLFVACLLMCALTLGAMLRTQPSAAELAHHAAPAAPVAALTTPSACALPPDGVVCPHPLG